MAIIYEIKRSAQHKEEKSRAQHRKLYLLGVVGLHAWFDIEGKARLYEVFEWLKEVSLTIFCASLLVLQVGCGI